MASEDETVEEVYHPKDAVGLAIEATLILGAVGLTVSAVQNTLTKQNVSGWGVFTRSGGIIGLFGSPLLPNWGVFKTTDDDYSRCGWNAWIFESCSCKLERER